MINPNFDVFEPAHSFNQDRDLFLRLNQYMDSAEQNLKLGRGWFIFNADRTRTHRITKLLLDRLLAYRPLISYYNVPWRDFSLNAYMREVELHDEERNRLQAEADQHLKQELNIARRVTTDTSWAMLTSDLVIISGIAPRHLHEVRRIVQVVGERVIRSMATVLVSPRMPHELATDFARLTDEATFWESLYKPMYQSGYLAL